MVKPMRVGDRVQVWTDKQGVTHGVAYNREPFKQVCRKDKMGMWGYAPVFVDPLEITCELCKLEI